MRIRHLHLTAEFTVSVHVQGNEVRTEGVHDTFLLGSNTFQATHPFTTICNDSDTLNAMGAVKGRGEEVPL